VAVEAFHDVPAEAGKVGAGSLIHGAVEDHASEFVLPFADKFFAGHVFASKRQLLSLKVRKWYSLNRPNTPFANQDVGLAKVLLKNSQFAVLLTQIEEAVLYQGFPGFGYIVEANPTCGHWSAS
jgi:hypothetical protein